MQWRMQAIFEDEDGKIRASYDIIFINCYAATPHQAKVVFLDISDIDLKLNNLLSEPYRIFQSYIDANKQTNKKYILIRKCDISNVYYPHIFVSNCYSTYKDIDKKTLMHFLTNFCQANPDYIIAHEQDYSDVIAFKNDKVVYHTTRLVNANFSNKTIVLQYNKCLLKSDVWKMYYIIQAKNHLLNALKKNIWLRLDSGCSSSQLYNDTRCDCQDQLIKALIEISKLNKHGLLIHIPAHDRKGFGWMIKSEEAHAQYTHKYDIPPFNIPWDTLENDDWISLVNSKDLRTFDGAASILNLLEIQDVYLITNNSSKIASLTKIQH
ncbi:MAG: hypothetical protein NMK33_02060 [Candidatus Cardinium sp.]|uniref:hypothetical protein n=1 Tax=Cardinium endosymbiont of Dermatophagoides farinae TaxID=2597823 RepID=UPI00118338A3|nr:hypothetical protein [Cardinium endosymbiont of Dermatophagoides farinae]TSJ81267.1 hypothetical protein FPG78_04735 [Cardinium endosymbiont of Dermatophagoides farinae]UWW97325.1 MAG: hypothetical protein NMK33_02060 [Candidatus Cardinium sp.]